MSSVVMIEDKKEWEEFTLNRPEANFLSSWNWGVFQKSLGRKVFALGLKENSQLVGAMLVVKEEAKRGNYLTLAGGPVIDWQNEKQAKLFVATVGKLAKEEGCLFVRVRPQILDTGDNRQMFARLGLKLAPMHVTADLTRQIDLTKSEAELLAQMRKNTRYEIKRIEREELRVKKSKNIEDIEEFYKHHLILAKKHKFVPFGYEFLRKQFEVFFDNDQALLFHAYQDDRLLASAFVIFYGSEAVYHYGISTGDNAKLPGSYACQWEAIKEAKNRGFRRYNLWGVAPEGERHHRFYGVSVFKRGFGGEDVAYLPAHDLPVSAFYSVVNRFEKLRAKSRKLVK